jgi:hypothetical protein
MLPDFREVLERAQVQDFLQRNDIRAQRLQGPDKEVELLVEDGPAPSEVLDVPAGYRDRHGISPSIESAERVKESCVSHYEHSIDILRM